MNHHSVRLGVAWCAVLFASGILAVSGAERQCEWTNVTRIVAVGDVHGDCDQLVSCLQAARVIDSGNRWIAGSAHLVQTGDVLDRGPTSKQAMDLLMRLEDEAEQAGGYVHALIGNHEEMVLNGDYGSMHRSEADPFGGMDEFKKAMAPEGRYGKWIRDNNAVVRINDIVFVHGGLSQGWGTLPLETINKNVRDSLRGGAATGPSGPLWYRGLAQKDDGVVAGVLEPTFRMHNIRHIVVGHTVTSSQRIHARGGGAVIMIDVGMSRTYRGGPAMCLVIEGGRFYAVTADKQEEIATMK